MISWKTNKSWRTSSDPSSNIHLLYFISAYIEIFDIFFGRSKYEYQLERTVLDIFREIKERKNAALKESFTKYDAYLLSQ